MRTLVWFRGKDLRLADHPALTSALEGGEVVCLFVLDPYFFAPERARALPNRMQYLLDAIGSLSRNLAHAGARLVRVEGKSVEVVPRLAKAWRVDRVVGMRWTEPFARARDERVAAALDVPFERFEGETLAPPGTLRNGQGRPFSVYSAFARAFREQVRVGAPLAAPRRVPPPPPDVEVVDAPLPTLESLGLPRNPAVLEGGERAARERLRAFLGGAAARYADERDRLDLASTSRLSADLKFGTLSARTTWVAAHDALARAHPRAWHVFSSELLWRELAYASLWDDPALLDRPHRAEFLAFPWEDDRAGWDAWCEGRTGYPLVDAAARQLLGEGFVHNRARMVAASFLTKHLRIDYRRGAAHYLAHLTDGDWAANDFGWQWTTGCGYDAAPYFRVFNPVEQARRFDPTGDYVRRWVPELARAPVGAIHAPWKARPEVLAAAGVELGATYPRPIVDHAEARARYLGIMRELGRTEES